jgi:hypothetical protein
VALTEFSFLAFCGHSPHYFPDRDHRRRNSVLQLCRDQRKSRERPHTGRRQSIDSQLAAKGFTKTDGDKPDLFVAYQVALGMEKQWTASGWGDRPSGPGGWGTAMGTATSSTIPVGALMLHVYDPAAKQSVWIGLATQTLDPSNNPEKNQKKLDKAMQKLLKNFPPKRQ